MSNNLDGNEVKKLIHRIGLKNNLKDDIINKIIVSPYKFAREIIPELELKEIQTENELHNIKTNFNFLYIGKLFVNFDRLKKINSDIKRYDAREFNEE